MCTLTNLQYKMLKELLSTSWMAEDDTKYQGGYEDLRNTNQSQ